MLTATALGMRRRWYLLAVAGLFLLLCLTYLMRPIMEPDFFWHLKTGEWIWRYRALPAHDPFSFTGPLHPTAPELVILQGYWLAQLAFYAVVSSFGLWGVFLLRVSLLAGFFAMFLWAFERHRVNRALAFALLILFSVFFLENYAFERPQVFTFAAIGLLSICYRRVSTHLFGQSRMVLEAVGAFLLMAIWSNLHGGVLIGQGMLALMAFRELVLFMRRRERQRLLQMLIILGAAICGSLLAPAVAPFEMLSLAGVGGESVGARQGQINIEYFSVFTWLFVYKNYKLLIPVALSLLCVLLLKEAFRRGNYVEIVLLALFWAFAYRYVRYLPIALVFSLLFVAWNYQPGGLLRHAPAPLLVAAGLSLLMWTSNEFDYLPRARAVGMVDPLVMPVEAADFLQSRSLQGKILNPINWGGYLIWRLAPEVQVAGDGRILNVAEYNQLSRLYTGVAGDSGRPLWREYVDRHRVDLAVVPLRAGARPSALVQGLARDPEWHQVYEDQISAVFMRRQKNSGDNRRE